MSLDETLRKTFDTLRQSVDTVLTREVQAAHAQMRAAMDLERRSIFEQTEQTARAAADLRAVASAQASATVDLERTRQAAYDEGFDAGRTDGWDAGRQHGTLEGRSAAFAEASTRELATSERLAASIRQIDAVKTVPDMLDLLLSCAMKEAARAAILIVRGSELQGWKFIGFGARTENPTEFRQAVLGAGVVEEAIRSGATASTHGPVRIPAPAFAELPLGRRAIGVPIVIQGRAVAVLYADQGKQAQGAEHPAEGVAWPSAIEIMTRHASRCLESSGALRAAAASSAAPASPSPALAGSAR